MQQICDGRNLWLYRDVLPTSRLGQPRATVSRVDLRQVHDEIGPADDPRAESFAPDRLVEGGLAHLLKELDAGADVCLTWRENRREGWYRRIQSRIGNGARNRLLGSCIRDIGSQLRAFRAACVEDLVHFDGMHRFMGNLFLMRGCRLAEVPVRHRPRHAGTTSYGMWNRALRGLKDLLGVRWLGQRAIRYGVTDENE